MENGPSMPSVASSTASAQDGARQSVLRVGVHGLRRVGSATMANTL
jgi:hypothetical protein